MIDQVSAFVFEGWLGTVSIATTLVLSLALALLSLFLFTKLKSSREKIGHLAKQLGYEPSLGDGTEFRDGESPKDLLLRDTEEKIQGLEQSIADLEAERERKDASLNALQQGAKELEDQLQQRVKKLEDQLQASIRNNEISAKAREQAETRITSLELMEMRTVNLEGERDDALKELQKRTKEFEDQLQQAAARVSGITAHAAKEAEAHRLAIEQMEDQMRNTGGARGSAARLTAVQKRARELETRLREASSLNDELLIQAEQQEEAHRKAVEEMEERMRGMNAASGVDQDDLQQRARELEEQLQQASLRNDEIVAQADEQAKVHRETLEQMQQRVRSMEAESNTSVIALQHRTKELEEQLQRVTAQNNEIVAQVGGQSQAHQSTVELMQQRIRGMEADKDTGVTALQQRTRELEEQLQQASLRNDEIMAQAGEQAQAHQSTVEQLEQRIHSMEADNNTGVTALQQRTKELEEQLQQASLRNDEIMAQAGEQAQTYQSTVEQLEQRIRSMEADNITGVTALQDRATELEEWLQQASLRNDETMARAGEQAQAHQSAVEQLEQRIRSMEAENDTTQQHARELEDRLQQASLRNDDIVAQANEQASAYREALEQVQQRIRNMEADNNTGVNALQQRTRELEERLQQASLQNDETMAQAGEQAQAYQSTVEQLEQRIHNMEADNNTGVNALQQRTRELEEWLRQASLRNDEIRAQAGEQAQAHRNIVEQMQQRIRSMEAESNTGVNAFQQRTRELEERLQQASLRNNEIIEQAGEQAQAHRNIVEQMQQRIRSLEVEGNTSVIALQQRTKELEDQLQHAAARHNEIMAQAGEQAQAHRNIAEQMQQRIRSLEVEGNNSVVALQQRTKELEDQLQHAAARHNEIMAQAGEQEQAYRNTLEQMQEHMRTAEAESGASLTALQQRATELENQLLQALHKSKTDESIAQEQELERIASMENLQLRIRELELENDARESGQADLQAHVKDLEAQLSKAAEHSSAANGNSAPGSSRNLLQRAEQIAACAVGDIRLFGLVAAEVYASAAVAADPHDRDAQQLLAELKKLRSASRGLLPSVSESVTTFDEKAANFFGSDKPVAALFAEKEAVDRYKKGLDRSALLVTNFTIALHDQAAPDDVDGTNRLHDMRESLLARLGAAATESSGATR